MQQRAFTILPLAVFIDLLDFGLLVPILPLLLTDQSSPAPPAVSVMNWPNSVSRTALTL
jgi:hypothetical protein